MMVEAEDKVKYEEWMLTVDAYGRIKGCVDESDNERHDNYFLKDLWNSDRSSDMSPATAEVCKEEARSHPHCRMTDQISKSP